MKERFAKTNNKRGSAILWSVIASGFMLALVIGALTVAHSVHQRSLDANRGRQAYFTARSVAETVAQEIAGGNASLVPDAVRGEINIYSVTLPEGMGECTASVQRTSADNLRVTARAEYAGVAESVSVKLTQKYRVDTSVYLGPALVSKNGSLDAFGAIKGDIYIDDTDIDLTADVEGSLFTYGALLANGGSVSGDVYAKSYDIASGLGAPAVLPDSITAESIGAYTLSLLGGYSWDRVADIRNVPEIDEDMFDNPWNSYTQAAPADVVFLPAQLNDITLTAGEHVVSGAALARADITVSGEGTVDLLVPTGYTLQVNSINYESEKGALNIILEAGSVLQITSADDVRVNIYEIADSADIEFTDAITVTGSIVSDNVRCTAAGGITLEAATGAAGVVVNIADGWTIVKDLAGGD